MSWTGERVHDPALVAAYTAVEELAEWSPWEPLEEALPHAPRDPGVYLLREPRTQLVRYAALAGERAGGGRAQGLHGRLAAYRTGRGAVGGFTEAALDRALADPAWLEHQLHRLRTTGAQRARAWGRDAVAHLAPEVSWSPCAERADAAYLADRVLALLRPHDLWDR